jgi:CoA:oxalate CoA-transferase
MSKPLDNVLIVDFSQFLSGPSCTLRLADFGAEVIKIEKPITGDICRQLYVSNLSIEGQSSLFHAINRNKKSFAADLKNEEDLKQVKKLVAAADIVVHNYRPGVMRRLGLDYDSVKEINSKIIYAEISGYGNEGPWKDEPGQDLLVQAVSGLTWLTGSDSNGPVPMGVSVTDVLAGTYLTQGILAALYNRTITGEGSSIQVNMLESSLDFQFEVFTTFLNDGHELPNRSAISPAHAYVAAPYGIYETVDGYIALAMGKIPFIGELIDCPELLSFELADGFTKRDEIKRILASHLLSNTTAFWLGKLEPADIWCAEVMTYEQLRRHGAYQVLDMEQEVVTSQGTKLTTTSCPLKINGERFKSSVAAPSLGQHNEEVLRAFSK